MEPLWGEQKKSDAILVGFCDNLEELSLFAEIKIHRGPKGIAIETIYGTLQHLFVHQVHHRGQVHSMLSGTNVIPPPLDEFYLRVDAQAREPELSSLNLSWPQANPLL